MQGLFTNVNAADFDAVVDSKRVGLYYLKNRNGLELSVTNFGARIVELFAPDRNGKFADIVLGSATLEEYLHCKGERFLGSAIGRFGNRIAGGKFTLGGKTYSLPLNNGKNSLHGGYNGFDMKVWDVADFDESQIRFRLVSPDGDEGYPGTLTVDMSYTLTDANALEIVYAATSDKTTIVNLTHHSFFNLRGEGVGDINSHMMRINADYYTPVDDVLIPTGEIAPVGGTPLDFRCQTPIGARVNSEHEQIKRGRGYDHNWILNKTAVGALDFAAEVYEPESGRFLKVYTTEPAMQFYGGNFFDGMVGKNGKKYMFRGSLALETQHYPDSPNRPEFPSTVLEPSQMYRHVCKYVFGAK